MPDEIGGGTVLLVDDQEGVRALLRRELTRRGHQVLEAADGSDALHLVRRRNGAVDVIVSDVVMPVMNGPELAAHIGVEFPDVPVILMSAFTPAGVARVGLSERLVPVLQKPFEPSHLAELVALALQHPAPASATPRSTPS
ncbi:MAG TPA: response regulator [Gemmatimonadales bacterium]|jgi:CheY-like chemotaxis protein|nr:response regulator [Gemmatimonadales bacterium]